MNLVQVPASIGPETLWRARRDAGGYPADLGVD